MATWRIHNYIAMQLKDELKVKNVDDYLVGSIYPDLPKLLADDSETSKELHMDMGKSIKDSDYIMDIFSLPNCAAFVATYGRYITDSDLVKGWLTHIITDFIFDDYMNRKVTQAYRGIIQVLCVDCVREFEDYAELRKFKHKNLKTYSNLLQSVAITPENLSVTELCIKGKKYNITRIAEEYIKYEDVSSYAECELEFITVEEYEILIERVKEYVVDIYKRLENW